MNSAKEVVLLSGHVASAHKGQASNLRQIGQAIGQLDQITMDTTDSANGEGTASEQMSYQGSTFRKHEIETWFPLSKAKH